MDGMHILLTNDDGIDAPGIAALARAVEGQGELHRVAPAGPMSECSHRVTTREPLRVDPCNQGGWAVHGTPADCVRLALHGLADRMPRPDWVLSGINEGGNLGMDLYMSGTVAAAREAAAHGIPAIAFSHYRRRGLEIDWGRASEWVAGLWRALRENPPGPGAFWNVNLPHLDPGSPDAEVVHCVPCTRPLPVRFETGPEGFEYRGVYAEREQTPDSDVAQCFGGRITISQVRI